MDTTEERSLYNSLFHQLAEIPAVTAIPLTHHRHATCYVSFHGESQEQIHPRNGGVWQNCLLLLHLAHLPNSPACNDLLFCTRPLLFRRQRHWRAFSLPLCGSR